MDKVITIFDWWDGPLCGLATYQECTCIYERIFDAAKDDWSNEYYLTPIEEETANSLLEEWSAWCETVRNKELSDYYSLSNNALYHNAVEAAVQKRVYKKAAAFCGRFDKGFIPVDYSVEWIGREMKQEICGGMVREAREKDLAEILQLYLFLHETAVPEDSEQLRETWKTIVSDENHHLIVCEADGKIVASCVCVIIPNLTRNVRPYAFVENVVTHGDYRKKGYATACLNYAREIAERNNCYKMMLLTGSKEESTLNFYRHAGYNSADKTAFIQWIDL